MALRNFFSGFSFKGTSTPQKSEEDQETEKRQNLPQTDSVLLTDPDNIFNPSTIPEESIIQVVNPGNQFNI